MFHPVIAGALALACSIATGWLGITQAMGAHPFWAESVAWIGAPAGLLVAGFVYLLGMAKRLATAGFALLALGAYALAFYGKTQFAASYAEDWLAGRFWYLGWAALMAAFTALIATALARPRA